MCLTSDFSEWEFEIQRARAMASNSLRHPPHFAGHGTGINQAEFVVAEIIMHSNIPTTHNGQTALIGLKPADVNICGLI